MSNFPEQTPERKIPTEQEIRLAMFELRSEIRAAQAASRKLAPQWDSRANTIRIGPGCCLPPTQSAATPKPRRM